MPFSESTLLILLPILFFGLLAPALFNRLKLPFVTSLILVGAVVGPHGLGYTQSNEVVEFLGFLGFTFLMLMAGLETDVGTLQRSKKEILILAFFNGSIPFLVGFFVTHAFGLGLWPALVVGTVFVSSSVAIVIPTIRSFVFRREGEGQVMATAILIEDVVSLFLLAIVFQTFSPITELPLPQYFVALIISVLFLRRLVPRVARKFFESKYSGETMHETQLRFVIFLMIAVLIFFSFLGVHPIIAAFLVGLLLSPVVTSTEVIKKLHTLGYGLFVPVFFFIVGMEMDLGILVRFDYTNLFILMLIISFFVSKITGGYVGGRFAHMNPRTSLFFGLASLPQLTTTLAAIYAASSIGIIGPTTVTAVTLLSILTTLLTPYILRVTCRRLGVRPAEEMQDLSKT